jgi:hypothetical protein
MELEKECYKKRFINTIFLFKYYNFYYINVYIEET